MAIDLQAAERTLDRILGMDLTDDDADAALADLLAVAPAISAAICARQPTTDLMPQMGGLPDRLETAIKKFREAAQRIGRALNASEVTIEVGVPLGVNVGLTFPVKETG